MSSSILNYQIIPSYHPLREFLLNLPDDQACNPNPDWIEQGSTSRYIIAFRSDNAAARCNRLFELLKKHDPRIHLVKQTYGPGQAFILFMLAGLQHNNECALALRPTIPIRVKEEPKDHPIPGAKQMEVYD